MTARIYVGTYAKYNAGSIAGAWLNLEDYTSAGAFIDACLMLHKDEADPELMFQDYEGFPKGFYSESCIKSELWDYLELDDDDRALLDAYQSAVDENGDIDAARDAFYGIHESASDFAADWYEQTSDLSAIPTCLQCHIDWEGVARDFQYDGWAFHRTSDGVFVFSPN